MKTIDYNLVLRTAVKAGEAIMHIYLNEDFNVEMKRDNSPLTKADKKAHELIVDALKTTEIPVLSEESEDKDYERRKHWNLFWLVDPLDGTKEFIKRNGEFTVNIALIRDGLAVAGVIFVPVSRELYLGIRGMSAWKIQLENYSDTENLYSRVKQGEKLQVNTNTKEQLIIVGSRSHRSEETDDYIARFHKRYKPEIISKGSSLKICMIAEGKAHLYPRFAPTMEWDTAAGHAIAVAAGAEIINWETKEELNYNKENLRNSWFLVKPAGMEF